MSAPQARRLVGLLTLLVVVDYADRATLGAVAPDVQRDLGLSLADLGLLGAAFGAVGGVGTLVAGVLVDAVPRLRLLAGSAVAWSLAMVATGSAQSLTWLLVARGCLSLVLATVGPAYPSLVGDAVDAEERGAALSTIDSGQLVGGGIGVGVGAAAVAVLSWRAAFYVLALPAAAAAVLLWRTREPERRQRDGERPSLAQVVVAVARNRTQVLVLLSGAAASYYLAGASAFSVVFASARYGISTSLADLSLLALALGGVVGTLAGGRLSDRLSGRGDARTRLPWSAAGYVAAALLWLPALFVHSLLLALPGLVLGAAALAGTIPVLDAVRVDVVAPALRGRAEAVRTVVRVVAEGAAPLVFGLVASAYGGADTGLQRAFLTALPGLVVAAAVLLVAAGSHDGDAAVAREQERRLTA